MTTTSGTLYVCATPIGNLSDFSQRAIDTLKHVSLIAAEDTRNTQILCHHFDIQTPLTRLDMHTEEQGIHTLRKKLEQGLDVALVTDAGTPNISDPGAHTIHQLSLEGVPIVPIPGPSAITTLLSASGILANSFYFAGYFPKKQSEITALYNTLPTECPIICYESPNRIEKTIDTLSTWERLSVIICGKELTKHHETIIRGTRETIKDQFKNINTKGEWCFLITLNKKESHNLTDFVTHCLQQQLSHSQTVNLGVNALGLPKNDLYACYLQLKDGHHD